MSINSRHPFRSKLKGKHSTGKEFQGIALSGIGILIISSYGDREITQPNRIMSGPPLRISRWNQFGQLRWLSTNIISIAKGAHSSVNSYEPRVQERVKWRSNRPTKLFLQLIQYIQIAAGSTSPHMTTIFNGRPSGIFIEIKSNFRSK